MTKIKTKNSTTASTAPTSGTLLQGELAVNITDKKLYVGNASGNPIELTNQVAATGSVSGVLVNTSASPATFGLQNNVLVNQMLHVGQVVAENSGTLNIYAPEDPVVTAWCKWITGKSYAGQTSNIWGNDNGDIIFTTYSDIFRLEPSGSNTVYLDSINASSMRIGDTPGSVFIGNSSSSVSILGDATVSKSLTADQINGDLDGPVVKACKNTDSITLRKGDPVFIAGSVGTTDVIEVQLARSDTSSKMPAVGLVSQTLTANATGYVTILGKLSDVDTSAFSVGNSVYVNSTGWITNVRPTGSSILVQNIGRIARSNSNNGQIIVLGPGRTNDVPNAINASGALTLGTPDIITPLANTATVFNTNATALNMGGAASTITMGAASSTTTFKGSVAATGSVFSNGVISTTGYVSAASGYRFTSSAVNAQTGTTYTLLSTDDGRVITMNNGSTTTVTVPTGLNVGFNTTVIQLGAGQVVFATGAGSPTLNSYGSALKITGQYGAASIISYASNSYNLAGTLTT